MAAPNPMRGEAEIGGKKIVINFNSLCALELRTGLKVPELLAKVAADPEKDGVDAGLGWRELRTWIAVFLKDDLSEEQAGDLIGRVGVDAALEALGMAMNGFFAPKEEKKAGNPRKAA